MPDIAGVILPPLGLALKAGTVGHKVFGSKAAVSQRARTEFIQSLEAFIESLMGEQPVVVAIDDFQWADGPSTDLLLYLSRRLDQAKFHFKIALFLRPVERQQENVQDAIAELAGGSGFARVRLDPFSESDIASVLRLHWRGADVDPSVPRFLHDKTGGVPLYVDQWLRALEDCDAVHFVAGSYILDPARVPYRMPAGLEPVFASRLSTVASEEREVLAWIHRLVWLVPSEPDV